MLYTAAYFALVAACIWLDLHTGIRRPLLVVTLPMLVGDCAANMLLFFQSWRNTMSGELWHHDHHPVWGKVRRGVDRAFFWQDAGREGGRSQGILARLCLGLATLQVGQHAAPL
jgi:hypothetical protein